MDCERAHKGKHFFPSGPRSWKESENNIIAFADKLEAENFKTTFFAVPEATREHSGLFKTLRRKGCEIGLHLHPRSFGYGINEYLGKLPENIQRDLLQRAKDEFEKNLEFSPNCFRGGYFSANTDTFDILRTLGFTHTSTTVPRRNNYTSGACWPEWRSLPYTLNGLMEAPVSSHEKSTLPDSGFEVRSIIRKIVEFGNNNEENFGKNILDHVITLGGIYRRKILQRNSISSEDISPPYLQIEHRDLRMLKKITMSHINYWLKNDLKDTVLVCATHNDVPYGISMGRHSNRLSSFLNYLKKIPNVIVRSSTLKEIIL